MWHRSQASRSLLTDTMFATVPAANLATFTPLEDLTASTSTAFLAPIATQTSSPSACIDNCFNNATGDGKETGCVGISGQYECICTFPTMMQSFITCMSGSCALDSTTVHQTLENVQQICASCNSDGCNSFTISDAGNGDGTETFSVTEVSVTPSASLCSGSTESLWTSSVSGNGGVAGGGFFSAGSVRCGSSDSETPTTLASESPSDAASPSGSSAGTPTSDALGFHSYTWGGLAYLALILVGTLA
ncbi:hypothetical protein DFH07DRAFT_841273 [Mycena maculata]|uniref:CFEM domain-containing protein n=1 Tax=Mycena maculata TaxID=230809 RepID=A0AAD7I9W1_9AGAR|nr:hypothetical protein DFH07DRAFT_841273 [Mycena maculata]